MSYALTDVALILHLAGEHSGEDRRRRGEHGPVRGEARSPADYLDIGEELVVPIYIERERGTTLESHDCPVWCAALTGSRLPNQAPAAPQSLDPGGGGPAAPPSRGRERKNPG